MNPWFMCVGTHGNPLLQQRRAREPGRPNRLEADRLKHSVQQLLVAFYQSGLMSIFGSLRFCTAQVRARKACVCMAQW